MEIAVLGRLSPALAMFFAAALSLRGSQACQQKDPERVKVTMVVILATEEGNFVDKRLKPIAEEVRKLNPQLKSFHLKSMTNKSLAPEEKVSFPLVDDRSAV